MKKYEELLNEKFAWSDVYDIARNLVERIDKNDADADIASALYDALDEELIYTEDQWTLCKYYTTPDNCSWNDVIEEFYNDLYPIVEMYMQECEY